ncbi:hypothetical protein AMECASPLE_035922 [Ameca splendens]|uniref:Uncharacterized protein n=1 Tax=Ameca splendens TaxID=208324 RepID=A0ABV0Y7T5_9TELE
MNGVRMLHCQHGTEIMGSFIFSSLDRSICSYPNPSEGDLRRGNTFTSFHFRSILLPSLYPSFLDVLAFFAAFLDTRQKSKGIIPACCHSPVRPSLATSSPQLKCFA